MYPVLENTLKRVYSFGNSVFGFNRVFRAPTGEVSTLPSNTENDPRVNRWLRICNNDVANIPIGLFVLFLAALYSDLHSGLMVALVWIFVGAPYIDWINAQPRLKGALSAITASVVGVILNLAIWFGLHVFFKEVATGVP